MNEHTGLPWVNPAYTRRDGHNACWIMDGSKSPKAVCRCFGPHAAEHAAYIKLACNAHKKLLAACEGLGSGAWGISDECGKAVAAAIAAATP